MTRQQFHIICLLTMVSCSSGANVVSHGCDFLLWSAIPEPQLTQMLEEARYVSIYEILARTVADSEHVTVEGSLVQKHEKIYLVPVGQERHADTFMNRVELVFSQEGAPPPLLGSLANGEAHYLVTGTIGGSGNVWQLNRVVYLREFVDRPDECAFEGVDSEAS